ncbi:hypothetical protein evm_006171 [Chilo suppressalis]|nr:hypothetical protein evm_006171 [Chilo suppressalis]
MMAKGLLFLIVTTMISPVFCDCPLDKIRSFGKCSFHIQCKTDVRDVALPPHCLGSTNDPVIIDLVLNNAKSDMFDINNRDREILYSVTTFRVSGVFPKTNLSMLEHMPHLRVLFLVNNRMEIIYGSPFSQLRHLEHLDLSHNNLTDIKDLLQFNTYPSRFRILVLAHNAIEKIPNVSFNGLSSLTELDLSFNRISDLSDNPFLNLTRLGILKLNNNRITDLNGALNELHTLKHLFLRGNQIQNFNAQSLDIIKELETFDLSSNQLEDLKEVVFVRHWKHFDTNSVCKILLSDNQIIAIPNVKSKEVFDRYVRSVPGYGNNIFTVTTELDLSNNAISNISYNAFQPLVRLVSLDLSHNKITNFDVNPRDMIYVKYLNLSCNFITNLKFDSFQSMHNLQNLDLSHNDLEIIPGHTFTNNNKLKYLNMTDNQIEKLEHFRIKMFDPEGGVLDLSNNSISQLSIPNGEGLHLNILVLKANMIADPALIYLCYQNKLETLDMSVNIIQELKNNSLNLPGTLSSLDLSNNSIAKIHPGTFKRIEQLRTLRLAFNKLTEIEYGTFQELKHLSYLDLSYNNITNLDSRVMTDLKSLRMLSLKYNGLYTLDYKIWLGHHFDLNVYLEGNNISCDWLAAALNDYNNGFSKMKPIAHMRSSSGYSLEGIPCEQDAHQLSKLTTVMADERLLVVVQKILRAVEHQNDLYKRIFMGHEINHKSVN